MTTADLIFLVTAYGAVQLIVLVARTIKSASSFVRRVWESERAMRVDDETLEALRRTIADRRATEG